MFIIIILLLSLLKYKDSYISDNYLKTYLLKYLVLDLLAGVERPSWHCHALLYKLHGYCTDKRANVSQQPAYKKKPSY